MTVRNRCPCGKVTSKYERLCKKCEKEHHDRYLATARAIVATKKCPDCGAPLRRNSALAGWYQCGAFGAPGFRSPGCEDLPPCNFQTFTE